MAYKAWKDMIQEYRIKHTTTEPYSPWQNCAELDVISMCNEKSSSSSSVGCLVNNPDMIPFNDNGSRISCEGI